MAEVLGAGVFVVKVFMEEVLLDMKDSAEGRVCVRERSADLTTAGLPERTRSEEQQASAGPVADFTGAAGGKA